MNVYLAGCRAKLARSHTHLRAFEKLADDWIKTNPHTFVHENNPDAREYVIRCDSVPEPPPEFGVVIGDALANLRSCLDNLVYAMAVAQTDQDPPPGEERCEFPIFFSESDFEKRRGMRKINMLSKETRAAILRLQPFSSEPHPTPSIRAALWLLHGLDRINKHRRLHLVTLIPEQIVFSVPPGVSGPIARIGPLSRGAPAMTFHTEGQAQVKVDATFTFQVALNEPKAADGPMLITETLHRLGTAVETVMVRELAPFFGPP